jgi:hypothetical protein
MLPSKLAVRLPDMVHLDQHAISGKAIVPAVELLNFLVETVDQQVGSLGTPLTMRDVRFPRFLPVDDIHRSAFEVALTEASQAGGGIRATLASRIELLGGMLRYRIHAEVTLGMPPVSIPPPPAEAQVEYEVADERVYRELVPFGPHFRNLHGTLRLGQGGAWSTVESPTPPHANPSRAGCPYLLDGAMHLACVWGQRYAGMVAYPTGFAARTVVSPTAAGRRRCVAAPRCKEPRSLLFDLWLVDEDHRVCDAVGGLVMVPLATGAPPPTWIALPKGLEVER